MKIIQFLDHYFNYDHISVIKKADDKTVIFTSGQSAIDGGFLIDLPVEEVLEFLEEARLTRAALKLDDGEKSDDDELVGQIDET